MQILFSLAGLMVSTSLFAQEFALPEGFLLSSGLPTVFVAKFALFIALLLAGTVAFGRLLKVLCNCPTIAGEIIGGIILGPSCLNLLGWPIFNAPLQIVDTLTGLGYKLASSDLFLYFVVLASSCLTVSYLLWIAGHETDMRDMFKVGLTATTAGILGAVLPILMTMWVAHYVMGQFSLISAIGMGLIFSATSVSIPVAMLVAQRKMHLKSSQATLGAAIIDDIFSIILLSVFFICLQAGTFGTVYGLAHTGHSSSIAEALIYMLLSFAGITFIGYFMNPPMLGWLKKHHSSFLVATSAHATMLLYFAFAELIGGLAGITGAFFAGLFHRMGDQRHQAEKVITPFVRSFLLPLFLGSIGLQINLRLLTVGDWIIVANLLGVAIVSKIIACYMATTLSNLAGRRKTERWSLLEGYLFGSSMVARGEVGLVISTILRGSHIITIDQYVIAVVVILLTTIASPLMIAIGFARMELLTLDDNKGYALKIGLFNVIGTNQLFNIIVGRIEASGLYTTSVNMSEGCKIVNLEGHGVKIMYDPEQGITFRGNRHNIEEILHMVKSSMADELERLPERM
jgi:Kef-type K+ transport system membrane component KefB